MKRSQLPFVIALVIVFGLFIALQQISKSPEESSPPPPGENDYFNPRLGLQLSLPEGWHIDEATEFQGRLMMARIRITRPDQSAEVTLRATDSEWEYFLPIVNDSRLSDDSRRSDTVAGISAQVYPVARGQFEYMSLKHQDILYEAMGEPDDLKIVATSITWIPRTVENAGVQFTRPARLPEIVQKWKQNCQHFDLTGFTASLVHGNKTYLFVTGGKRPTTGYRTTITETARTGRNRIAVFTTFSRPDPDQRLREETNTPYDLIALEGPDFSIDVVGMGNDVPYKVTSLVGIEELRPIVAQSRTIKVFDPAPRSATGSVISYTGAANVFEATVQVRIVDTLDTELTRTFTTAAVSMDWGAFADSISVPPDVKPGSTIILELYTIDQESGDMVDLVSIPLMYMP